MSLVSGSAITSFQFSWWTRGDLDGFFGLFVDNLIQLILITVLCTGLLGMPNELVFGRILPGVAISLLIGNLFYAWQAKRLSLATGKATTALPYGVNTVSLFAFVLFVMLPVVKTTGNAELAWRMGLAACFGSGIIEFAGAWIAGRVKKVTPRCRHRAGLESGAYGCRCVDGCYAGKCLSADTLPV